MRGNKLALCACLMVIVVVAAPGICVAKSGPQYQGGGATEPETWTLAVFVSGDNNLEKYWDEVSLPSLLMLPANDGLTIVAFVDRLSTAGTEVVEISGTTVTPVVTYEEMNFGDGGTFRWFLEEVRTDYPSDKLAVVAWDHGYAWRYISDDVSSGGDRITMPELRAAIEGAGVYIDVLAFDACNMAAVEVVYEVALTGLVGIVVGSEESVPTTGFPYDLTLMPTALDTSRTPAELATDMVLGYQQLYEGQTWASTVALSAVSAPALLESAATITAWTDAMRACLPVYAEELASALRSSYIAWCTHYHVDLVDLGDSILADPSIADAGLIDSTVAMVAAVDGTVLAHWGGSAALDNRGMTLWWGTTGDWKFYSEAYADVDYAKDTGWYEFLDAYN